jgi:hypothetical protein
MTAQHSTYAVPIQLARAGPAGGGGGRDHRTETNINDIHPSLEQTFCWSSRASSLLSLFPNGDGDDDDRCGPDNIIYYYTTPL